MRRLYNGMLDAKKMAVNTLEAIHNVLHQVFKLAVEDRYIRLNPTDEILGDIKQAHNFGTPNLFLPENRKTRLEQSEGHSNGSGVLLFVLHFVFYTFKEIISLTA